MSASMLAQLLSRTRRRIEEDDTIAERDHQAAGGGEPERADLALELP